MVRLFVALVFFAVISYVVCAEICEDPDMEYQECGKECEDVCQNTYRKPLFCTARCKRGCFCKNGFLKDLVTNKCVLPKDCPRDE